MTIQPFNSNINLLKNLFWQYDNSPNLKGLIQNQETFVNENVGQFLQDFYTNIFNLDTANTFGLKIWSILLGVPFDVETITPAINDLFGFEYGKNFDHGVLYPDAGTLLSDAQKRLILKLRWRTMTTNATLESLIEAYQAVLGDTFVTDGLNMKILVGLGEYPTFENLYIIEKYPQIFPRPAGVEVSYLLGYNGWIRFDSGTNFDNGNFGA